MFKLNAFFPQIQEKISPFCSYAENSSIVFRKTQKLTSYEYKFVQVLVFIIRVGLNLTRMKDFEIGIASLRERLLENLANKKKRKKTMLYLNYNTFFYRSLKLFYQKLVLRFYREQIRLKFSLNKRNKEKKLCYV